MPHFTEFMNAGQTGVAAYDSMPTDQRTQYEAVSSLYRAYQYHANADRGHDYAAECAASAAYSEAKAAYEQAFGTFDSRVGDTASYAAQDLAREGRQIKTAA